MIPNWRTVSMIASNREATRQGKGHLTPHALEVLSDAVQTEEHAMVRVLLSGKLFKR